MGFEGRGSYPRLTSRILQEKQQGIKDNDAWSQRKKWEIKFWATYQSDLKGAIHEENKEKHFLFFNGQL